MKLVTFALNSSSRSATLVRSSRSLGYRGVQKNYFSSNYYKQSSFEKNSSSISNKAAGLTTAALVLAASAPSYQYLFEKNDENENNGQQHFNINHGHHKNSYGNSAVSVALCDWGWGGWLGLCRRGSSAKVSDKPKYNILKRKSQSINRDDSANFQMMQALEIKDEFQKIKLARFLRELHGLAISEKEKANPSLSSYESSVKRRKTKKGEISLQNVDLLNLSVKDATKYRKELREGRRFSRDSIIDLTTAGTQICLKDNTLVDLREAKPEKVTVVGDLHGSLKCLDHVLDLAGKLENHPNQYLVFCGDYVDRGSHSLEVFCSLLFLKLAYPKQVILLRGNHEDVYIASVYGFQEEIRSKYGPVDGDLIWEEMRRVFMSLPYCVRSNRAFMVHGGLPSRNFQLSQLDNIDSAARMKVESVVEHSNDTEKLLGRLIWSDPSRVNGIRPNPRGCGIEFGPDVAKDFLDRHNLDYIIRSHEPMEQGIDGLPCGDDKYVVTVFSTASYPNGAGTNLGAVVHINEENGDMDTIQFEFKHEKKKVSRKTQAHTEFLRSYLKTNRSDLEGEFKKVELDSLVTVDEWVRIMSEKVQISGAGWTSLQPSLAPTTTPGGKYVNWVKFLNKYGPKMGSIGGDQANAIYEHEDELVKLFKVLDIDGNGTVDREEFITGVEMLNKTVLEADGEILSNPGELFDTFDDDGNGEIDLDEFVKIIDESKVARKLSESVDSNKINALMKNQEMLLIAFRYLDRDGSGTIDREEFRTGIDLLNKRLPKEEQFGDPDELFTTIDGDGSGEIDITEFNHILQQTISS